jgi:hypothetical protein
MATAEELTQRRKDAIKRRMERTRARLAGRLHTLSETIHGVRETVESTVETVQQTVENVENTVKSTIGTVQGTVKSTVDTVQDTVKSTVDTAREALDVSRHPFLWFGGSVAAGYLAGRWLHSEKRPAYPSYPAGFSYPPPTPAPAPAGAASPPPAAEHHKPGVVDHLKSVFGNYFDQVKGMGVGVALGLLRDLVAREVPEGLRSEVMEVGNNVIKDLGGEVLQPNLIDPDVLTGKGHSEQSPPRREEAERPPAPTRRPSQPVPAGPY